MLCFGSNITQRRIYKYITQSCIVYFWFIRDYAVICSRKSAHEQREHLVHIRLVVLL